MIVLYIILGIIVLIYLLLHIPVVAQIIFSNNKQEIKVKYLFFTLYPINEKKKNKSETKSKNKKKKNLEKELEKEKQEYEEALKQADIHSNREDAYKEFLPEGDNSGQAKKALKEESDEGKILEENINTETFSKKEQKSKNKKSEKEDKNEKEPKGSKLEELKRKWEKIKPYIPLGKKTVKKLFKAIRITKLELDLAVANEDAYECAMSYGYVNAAVFNALAVLKTFLNVSVKRINITSKFNSSETEYNFYCQVKTRPSTVLAILVFILVNYLYTMIKMKIKAKKQKKTEMEMLNNE